MAWKMVVAYLVGLVFNGIERFAPDLAKFLQDYFPNVQGTVAQGLLSDKLKVLEILRQVLPLLRFPDLSDKDACRAYLVQVDTVLADWAAKTDTTWDDDGVKLIRSAIENDAVWDLLWKWFQALRNSSASDTNAVQSALVAEADASGIAGINPATIVALLTAIAQIVQAFLAKKS